MRFATIHFCILGLFLSCTTPTTVNTPMLAVDPVHSQTEVSGSIVPLEPPRSSSHSSPVTSGTPNLGSMPGVVVGQIVAVLSPPELDPYSLNRRLGGALSTPEVVPINGSPTEYKVGIKESFTLHDLEFPLTYTIEAELRLVTPSAYWYVQEGIFVSGDKLTMAGTVLEKELLPDIQAHFGPDWQPGVRDGERLTILNARLQGAVAYYHAADQYPKRVYPGSNERTVIYLDPTVLEVASPGYYGGLAHEMQHALHWSRDPTEEAWVNEGLSEIAAFLAGYPSGLITSYQHKPATQLNAWAMPTEDPLSHYGASHLFFRYLANHYGGYSNLKHLVSQSSEGINGINQYLAILGYEETFLDVFRDWVVANYLSSGHGRYAYDGGPIQLAPTHKLFDYGEVQGTVPQYSAHYVMLDLTEGAAMVTFDGAPIAELFPYSTTDETRCWWSNIGDSIDSRLFRSVDLSEVDKATLTFSAWYDIEEAWDHAYIIVSTDSGETWDILAGRLTTVNNPVGASYGPALTGRSADWQQESVDLSPYSGQEVLFGFEYVTDESTNGYGLCVDNIAIAEVGYLDDGVTTEGWNAEGFMRVSHDLSQEFIVQVLGIQDERLLFSMEMTLDDSNKGQVVVEGFGELLDSVVVVITPVTEGTLRPASYNLTVSPVLASLSKG